MVADHPRRRKTDRGWRRLPERWYRDLWLTLISGLMVFALWLQAGITHEVRTDQQRNTVALCAFRTDIQKRYDAGRMFLLTHPAGIPGISARVLKVSITNEASTLKALAPLEC